MLAPPAAAKQENAKLGELGNRQKKKSKERRDERKGGREGGKEGKGRERKGKEANKVSPAGGEGAAAWCTMCMSSDRLSECE